MPAAQAENLTDTAVRLFLSHASEDKAGFVEPLAQALKDNGFVVWYDKFVLTMGDSLLRKINEGLRECDYGVVVLSPAFFAKQWPQSELDGLFALENEQRKVILPVWKDLTKAEVAHFSPILAGRLAAQASEGIPRVVEMIRQAISVGNKVASFSPEEALKAKFTQLSDQYKTEKNSSGLLNSYQGTTLVCTAVGNCFTRIETLTAEMNVAAHPDLHLQVSNGRDAFNFPMFSITAPYNLQFVASMKRLAINSASQATLKFSGVHLTYDIWGQPKDSNVLFEKQFTPFILPDTTVQWIDADRKLLPTQLPTYIMDLVMEEIIKARQPKQA